MRIKAHFDPSAKRQGRHYTPLCASRTIQLDDSIQPRSEKNAETGVELLKLG